jgi:hypothetical protein
MIEVTLHIRNKERKKERKKEKEKMFIMQI